MTTATEPATTPRLTRPARAALAARVPLAQCDNCRFFRRDPRSPDVGECRRRAPVPSVAADGPPGWATWPEVLAEDGCGEHRPLIDEDARR
jgi:hypothetical protein